MNDNTKNDGWEECPRCGSNRSMVIGKTMMFIILMFLSSGTMIIGILIPPLWIATIGFFILGFVILFIPNVKRNVCKDCNNNWKPKD